MILSLFIPQKIGSFYLIPTYKASIVISSVDIIVSIIKYEKNELTLINSFSKKLYDDINQDNESTISSFLKEVIKKSPKNTEFRIIINSSFVLFKKLQLPFSSNQKIKMVLPFEIEPLLPLPIDDTCIDFIITETDNSYSNILVFAYPKKKLFSQLELFNNHSIPYSSIGLDACALYNSYENSSYYKTEYPNAILADIGWDATKIVIVKEKVFENVRIINKGIVEVINQAGKEVSIPIKNIFELIFENGINGSGEQYDKVIQSAMNKLSKDIVFTIESFQSGSTKLPTIILSGSATLIPQFKEYFSKQTTLSCITFDNNYLKSKTFNINPKVTLNASHTISIGGAIEYPYNSYNLFPEQDVKQSKRYLFFEGITFASLAFLLIGLIAGTFLFRTHILKKELTESSADLVKTLYEQFPEVIDDDETDIHQALEIAEREILVQEQTWSKFAKEAHPPYLDILLELTNVLNVDLLGLIMEEIQMTDDIVTLKGNVKDQTALIMLEKELRSSKMFKLIGQPPELLHFTLQIKINKKVR